MDLFYRPFFLLRLLAAAVVCCLIGVPGLAAGNAPARFTIAYQPGLGYAPLLIIKQTGWIEKDYPQTTVDWRELANGATIRDGMISDTIQVGTVGTAPYLVGWDRGVEWKVIASTSNMDLWLTTLDPNIKSLKDIKPGQQIATPALDAIQAFVLRKGADDELHNPHALDANIVTLPHPQGLLALMNHQVVLHFTSPPFEFEEADKGAHVVYSSQQAFGNTTFTCTTMTQSFYDRYPEFATKFLEYMQRADKLINSDPATAAKYIAEAEGKPQLADQYKAWMTRKGINYTVTPSGFLKYAAFMKKIGTISKVPASIKDLELPPAQRLGGS